VTARPRSPILRTSATSSRRWGKVRRRSPFSRKKRGAGSRPAIRGAGLLATDLVPAPRVAGREPILRFQLEHDGKRQALSHLRVLVSEIRKLGEHGMKVKRFKGLGEMDGDELWETTLDPARRTLVKVQLEDALKAEDMFRTLMGEKVEPRREFIQKHALEVKEIDYHGA